MAKYLVSGPTLKYTGELAKFASEKRTGERTGDKFGKRTGLSITAYADELLVANEKANETDGVLQAELVGEFPNRKAVQAISAYRGYFNAGKHGHNPSGKFHSTCHGRNTGEGAVKPRKDESHPNVKEALEARRAAGTIGTKPAKATEPAKGKGKPPAKGKAPVKGKAPAKPATKPAKAAKAAKPAKPAKGKAGELAAS